MALTSFFPWATTTALQNVGSFKDLFIQQCETTILWQDRLLSYCKELFPLVQPPWEITEPFTDHRIPQTLKRKVQRNQNRSILNEPLNAATLWRFSLAHKPYMLCYALAKTTLNSPSEKPLSQHAHTDLLGHKTGRKKKVPMQLADTCHKLDKELKGRIQRNSSYHTQHLSTTTAYLLTGTCC